MIGVVLVFENLRGLDFLSNRISYLVGNGQRLGFWRDEWYDDEPLNVSFPSLFSAAASKDAWLADVWIS